MASRILRRAPAAFFLIVLAGFAPTLARAQSTGSAESTLWGSMLKGLGMGGDNNIEYRERPPLVVPQTRDLPPPQATGAPRPAPNWPGDPKSASAGTKGTQVHDLDRIPVEVGAKPTVAPPPPPEQSTSLFGKLFNNKGSDEIGVPPTPSRKSLTEPPLDYQSPSPSQPYGLTTARPPEKPATGQAALAAAPGSQPPPGAPTQ
jgi:hypothetical protein